jgi:hypothetical protein
MSSNIPDRTLGGDNDMAYATQPYVDVLSPEDPLRAKAIEAGELAKTLAAQVVAAASDEWLANIEPEARDYYNIHNQAEKALLLSIAISVMRLAAPAPVATGAGGEDNEFTSESGLGWFESESIPGEMARPRRSSTRAQSKDRTGKGAHKRGAKRTAAGKGGRGKTKGK